jgi:hypothetical protein
MSTKHDRPDFRALLISLCGRGHDPRRIFDAFCRFAACALACETREAEYLEEAKRWSKPELELFSNAFAVLVVEMETRPFEDLLGPFYMEFALSKSGASRGGEFHTPQAICQLMAQMTAAPDSFPADGPITVCEPCCGSGAMILALAQSVTPEIRRRLRVTAIDINATACHMTFINTTLWGVPCRVIHGNALWLDRECWGAWTNIHHICPWLPLALRLTTPEAKTQGLPPAPVEIAAVTRAVTQSGQLDFFGSIVEEVA